MKKILFCDNDFNCERQLWDVIIVWNQYSEGIKKDNKIYITDLVESNDVILKNKFLEWLHNLGETKVGKKKIKEHFVLHDEFSYWWGTHMAQKANFYESKNIVNILKLFQLADLFQEYKISSKSNEFEFYFIINDKDLLNTLKEFANENYINWVNFGKNSHVSIFNDFIDFVVNILKSYAFLSQKALILLFDKKNLTDSVRKKNVFIALFDIFIYTELDRQDNNILRSSYWTVLLDHLYKKSIRTNRIHLFHKSRNFDSYKKVTEYLDRINNNNEKFNHFLVNNSLTLTSIFLIAKRYLQLTFKYFQLDLGRLFKITNSSFNVYDMYRKIILLSFVGVDTMKTLYQTELYKNYLGKSEHLKLGIYVQENQPWELALLFFWRKYKHGKIFGYPNAVLRFWDMRYYYHELTLFDNSLDSLPQPDYILVNGLYAKKYFLMSGFLENKIILVEALRYLYLNKYKNKSNIKRVKDGKLRVLILTDNLTSTQTYFMEILNKICPNLSEYYDFFYKPHPAKLYSKNSLPFAKIVQGDLENILDDFNVGICSAATSSSLECFYANIHTVVFKDPEMLNISPLRGQDGIHYFYDSHSLENKLYSILESQCQNEKSNFLELSFSIKYWKYLLKQHVV